MKEQILLERDGREFVRRQGNVELRIEAAETGFRGSVVPVVDSDTVACEDSGCPEGIVPDDLDACARKCPFREVIVLDDAREIVEATSLEELEGNIREILRATPRPFDPLDCHTLAERRWFYAGRGVIVAEEGQ